MGKAKGCNVVCAVDDCRSRAEYTKAVNVLPHTTLRPLGTAMAAGMREGASDSGTTGPPADYLLMHPARITPRGGLEMFSAVAEGEVYPRYSAFRYIVESRFGDLKASLDEDGSAAPRPALGYRSEVCGVSQVEG